ncbi:MAG: ABC transporter permease subunit [Lentisphaerae bacterium]|nr:ABC transporter permease subunit [Lentisphaerota bacterium]
MPIISRIGRRAPQVRLLVGAIYLVLTLGSITTVYPLLIMLAGSTKSGVDVSDFAAVPAFLRNDLALYRKHIEGLYNESLDSLNIAGDSEVASFAVLEPPAVSRPRLVRAWREFLEAADLPHYAWAISYSGARVSRAVPRHLREFKAALQERFDDDIEALNRAMGTEFVTWNSLYINVQDNAIRRTMPATDDYAEAFREFAAGRGLEERVYLNVEGFYKRLFLRPQYTRSIDEYNRQHGTAFASYADIRLPPRWPAAATDRERDDWETFVRHTLNLLWIRADPELAGPYRAFLAAKYRTVDQLNRRYETAYSAFDEVPLVEEPPFRGVILSDWDSFITGWKDPDSGRMHQADIRHLRLHSPDTLFRDWLRRRYETVAAANDALGTAAGDFADFSPPQEEFHWEAYQPQRGALRLEFATRNYRTVLEYMLFHGRGVVNTIIYCTLAVLAALVVNPMAAYAMSRYRMPTTYKVLLFLLLTMAFPPMVTQIPVFLMLRQLGLLNTFAALLLPGLANGYSIFLLKGFFDSLGQELFESAQIDGASEWVMFWNITMALSKPILAVIALNAFTGAYANFMFALLICQDPKMWTLMVWLYRLNSSSGAGVIYASLIIAAIPTLLVFVFCQNIIMRGIVVPVEK